ncbi:SAM-dependent methyltransferase [Yoonia sp. SS1-5]|uniref:Class I SAM-dependent methyltransferase n=1 Tax=Yoonia rhodophyticola TaxID=3137370 RepID=A0AAN0MCU8_9RHOB
MTTLLETLCARIGRTGPMTVADYMQDCLMHPQYGYYSTRDPLGSAGDFTTAPEISQMFGELMGLCLAQAWLDQGAPPSFTLAELGPGRGTLMADMLRATVKVPGFHDAAKVHFVETSAALKTKQAEAVPDAVWHDTAAQLPDAPLFLVANEFLDALPVRQFIRDAGGWRERMIGARDGALYFGLSDPTPLSLLDHRLADTKPGDLVEHCPALSGITTAISNRIAEQGGAAVIIDYGDWQSLGDTLQAMANHAYVDPLAAPGDADLTTHVDFAAIARHAAPARHTRLTTQGMFLERLGITQRAQTLAAGLEGAALDAHIKAHRRLTHPGEMGDLFKVIGLYPATGNAPPGLEP